MGPRRGRPEGTFYNDNPKPGRNEPCPCGSGKKYKRCCDLKIEVVESRSTPEGRAKAVQALGLATLFAR